jgi:hypothetical protein
MVPGRFVAELATERTHPYVDWKAYYAVRQRVEALGFYHLGDVDVVSLQHDSTLMKRPVLAVFASDDATNVLGHYQLPLRWTVRGILARFMGGRGNVFDIGTNFGGGAGVMLATTTAQAAAVWDMPDFIMRETLSRSSPLEQVIQRHRDRVQDYQTQHPAARPVTAHTLRDIVRINDIMEQRKLQWRRDRGWITREELGRLSNNLSSQTLDDLYEAIQNVAREQ